MSIVTKCCLLENEHFSVYLVFLCEKGELHQCITVWFIVVIYSKTSGKYIYLYRPRQTLSVKFNIHKFKKEQA